MKLSRQSVHSEVLSGYEFDRSVSLPGNSMMQSQMKSLRVRNPRRMIVQCYERGIIFDLQEFVSVML